MRNFKPKLLTLLAILVVAVSAAGCNNNRKPSAPEIEDFAIPEGGYNGQPVTIKFYHTMSKTALQPTLQTAIAEFNKLYPAITVEEDSIGGYDEVREQIKNELSVGDQPNLAYCYPDHVALYNKAKGVQTLDVFIDSEITQAREGGTEVLGLTAEQKADFIKGYYDEGRQFGDGKMYTLPFSKSTEVLYYDETFFAAHNLTVPTTWDEMETVCKAIREIDPTSVPLGYDSEANWFITMCEQYKSPYTSATAPNFLFNNDKNKEFVTKFKEWYDNGYMTTQVLYGGYTSGLFTAAGTADAPRCYMCIGSSAGANHQKAPVVDGVPRFEVGIAPIPQVDKVNSPAVISQGPSVCIFKNDDPQKVIASWLLLKFLTTDVAFQAEFSIASGYIPVIKSVNENAAYADFIAKANGSTNLTARAVKVGLEQEAWYFTSPAFIGSSKARDQVGTLMTTALNKDNDKSLDELFKEAIDECEYSIQ